MRKEGIRVEEQRLSRIWGGGERRIPAAQSGGARDPWSLTAFLFKAEAGQKGGGGQQFQPGKGLFPLSSPSPSLQSSPRPLTDGHSFPGIDPAKAVAARPAGCREELPPGASVEVPAPKGGSRSREAGSGWGRERLGCPAMGAAWRWPHHLPNKESSGVPGEWAAASCQRTRRAASP